MASRFLRHLQGHPVAELACAAPATPGLAAPFPSMWGPCGPMLLLGGLPCTSSRWNQVPQLPGAARRKVEEGALNPPLALPQRPYLRRFPESHVT